MSNYDGLQIHKHIFAVIFSIKFIIIIYNKKLHVQKFIKAAALNLPNKKIMEKYWFVSIIRT